MLRHYSTGLGLYPACIHDSGFAARYICKNLDCSGMNGALVADLNQLAGCATAVTLVGGAQCRRDRAHAAQCPLYYAGYNQFSF